jgi:hypothetical protein
MSAELSPPSDIVPGIAPIFADRAHVLRKIDVLQTRLDELKPFVVRVGTCLRLYFGQRVVVQTQDAQGMIDYTNAFFSGTAIHWCLLPAEQSLNPS